ncbi:MAG: hypothetical protein EOM22_00185 [Gammaproteobacteria bacterium]|nr:hypothetical protein [Gammaproteobacteria bacterium]
MQQSLITAAYALIRFAIGSGLFDRASSLVRNLIFADIPGAEKKAQVIEFLKREGAALSGIAVDLLIAIVRARFEAK